MTLSCQEREGNELKRVIQRAKFRELGVKTLKQRKRRNPVHSFSDSLTIESFFQTLAVDLVMMDLVTKTVVKRFKGPSGPFLRIAAG